MLPSPSTPGIRCSLFSLLPFSIVCSCVPLILCSSYLIIPVLYAPLSNTKHDLLVRKLVWRAGFKRQSPIRRCPVLPLCSCAGTAPPEEGHSDPPYEAAVREFEEGTGPELRWETRLVLGPGTPRGSLRFPLKAQHFGPFHFTSRAPRCVATVSGSDSPKETVFSPNLI